MLHQWDKQPLEMAGLPNGYEFTYPDTGIPIDKDGLSVLERWQGGLVGRGHWWQQPMHVFAGQVRKHCHECSVPLRGHGELAMADLIQHELHDEYGPREQVSETHKGVYKPKRKDRRVELVTLREQLGEPLGSVTRYIQNASK